MRGFFNYIQKIWKSIRIVVPSILAVFFICSVFLLFLIQFNNTYNINYCSYYKSFLKFYNLNLKTIVNFFLFMDHDIRIYYQFINNKLLLIIINNVCDCILVLLIVFIMTPVYITRGIYMYYQFLELLLDLFKLLILKSSIDLDTFVLKHPKFDDYTLILERPDVTRVVFYLLVTLPEYYNTLFGDTFVYLDAVCNKTWFFFYNDFGTLAFIYSLASVPLAVYLGLLHDLSKYWVYNNLPLLGIFGRLLNFFICILYPAVIETQWLTVIPYPSVVIHFVQKNGHPWGTTLTLFMFIIACIDHVLKTYILERCIFTFITFSKKWFFKFKLYFNTYKLNACLLYIMFFLSPKFANFIIFKFVLFALIVHMAFWMKKNNNDY